MPTKAKPLDRRAFRVNATLIQKERESGILGITDGRIRMPEGAVEWDEEEGLPEDQEDSDEDEGTDSQ